jgi:c-di-GMP-related signal transduction protein
MQRIDDQHSIPTPYSLSSHRIVNTLLDLTRRSDLDYSRFCEIAEGEPWIAWRIMRDARSILAGRENGIERLRHALAFIGLRRAQDILIALDRELRDAAPQD